MSGPAPDPEPRAVVLGVLDGLIVELVAGVDGSDGATGGGYIAVSSDGVAWDRRSLPESIGGQEFTYDVIRDAIYLSASGSRWVTLDLGASWLEWRWEQPDIGLDGLTVGIGPYFYARTSWDNARQYIGSHSGQVGGRSFMYEGEPYEFSTDLRPPDDVISREFGPFEDAWQSGSGAFDVETERGTFYFTRAVSAAGRDIAVDFINENGEVFHTGRLSVPAGFDVEELVSGMQEQWLMVPGMWWSDDGIVFEWKPVTDLPLFLTEHLAYATGVDATFAFSVRPPGERSKMWRLDPDGRWWQLALPDDLSSVTALAQGQGVLAALGTNNELHVSRNGGSTFESAIGLPPGPMPAGSDEAEYDEIFVTQSHMLVAASGTPYVWIAPHDVSSWTLMELPATPSAEAGMFVTDGGTIYFQDEAGRWVIGEAG